MEDVVALPHFNTKSKIECSACNKCVAACPGLAITVVDTRKDAKQPLVSFPFEVDTQDVAVGRKVVVVDDKGATLGEHPVTAMEHNEEFNTYLAERRVVLVAMFKKVKCSRMFFSPQSSLACLC